MSRITRRQFGGLLAAGCAGLVASGSAKAAKPGAHRIEIKGFRFKPARLVIKAGDTVEWVNLDTAPHTATARDGGWDTKTLKKSETRSVSFKRAGTQAYSCKFHRQMVGEIVVQ